MRASWVGRVFIGALLCCGMAGGGSGAPAPIPTQALRVYDIGAYQIPFPEWQKDLFLNNRGQVAGGQLDVSHGGLSQKAFFWDPAAVHPQMQLLGYGEAAGLNDEFPPKVVLHHSSAAGWWDYLWNGTAFRPMTPTGFHDSRFTCINNSGMAAVDAHWYLSDNNPCVAAVRVNLRTGAEEWLATADYDYSGNARFPGVTAINERGEVIGTHGNSGVLWELDGTETDLGHLVTETELDNVQPLWINNAASSQVVGVSTATSGPFYWTRETGMHLIASDAVAKGLNDRGEVLIQSGSGVTLWRDANGDGKVQSEESTYVDIPEVDIREAIALNNATPSQVLVRGDEYPSHAPKWYVWSAGGVKSLGNPFPPAARDASMLSINNRGDVLGKARIGKQIHAFLFRPVASR